jgi:transposase
LEQVDAHLLSAKAQKRIRQLAVKAVLEGAKQVAVAKLYGVTRRALAKWLKSYRDGGVQALTPKSQGRPKGGSLLPWQANVGKAY